MQVLVYTGRAGSVAQNLDGTWLSPETCDHAANHVPTAPAKCTRPIESKGAKHEPDHVMYESAIAHSANGLFRIEDAPKQPAVAKPPTETETK